MNHRSFLIAIFFAPVILSGCGGDMTLIARKAWTEITTTPLGTVSTRWAALHPRNLELEMELEYLNHVLNYGPRTYGVALYELSRPKDELLAIVAEWRSSRLIAVSVAERDPS